MYSKFTSTKKSSIFTIQNTITITPINYMYMKKTKVFIFSAFVILLLTSCAAFKLTPMTSSVMNKLELGMSKEQVTTILGTDYTIAEKRIEDGNKIEVLSYRDVTYSGEFYMFVFKNDSLEKWYRILQPKESTTATL